MRRALLLLLVTGCGVPPAPPADAGFIDAGTTDAGFDAGLSKAAGCATDFGAGLPPSFGRFDGVVTAVVTPADTATARS